MQRYRYDKSHFVLNAGDLGRLQTQMCLPVVAGESIEVSFGAVMRLSALRRNLTLDAKVENFLFFVPHRQSLPGTEWVDFIKAGIDEATTFTNGPTTGNEQYFGFRNEPSGGGANFPYWVAAGYNQIWNRYFRAPTDIANERTVGTYVETDERGIQYGSLCGRLKTPWSTGIDETVGAADREVTITASKLDVVDLRKIQARYKSEQEKDFFSQRYTDVLKNVYGGSANTDADERPTLCMRQVTMMSGYDIDGTSDASLGTFSGKAAAIVKMHMPSRFFPEHGILWLMTLVRWPTLVNRERHFLVGKNNPTYLEISGDPDLIPAQEPIVISADDWFADGASNDLGTAPYGQWYRHQPNYIHQKYDVLQGFPFLQQAPTSKDTARYHIQAEYDNSFKTTQLGQWNTTANIRLMVKSPVPPARTSIFAGAK